MSKNVSKAKISSKSQPSAPSAFEVAPPALTGMTVLDRDAFRKTVPVIALDVPASSCADFRKKLLSDGTLFDVPRCVRSLVPTHHRTHRFQKGIVPSAAGDQNRLVLLSPRYASVDDLPEATRALISDTNAKVGLCSLSSVLPVDCSVILTVFLFH
jgi:hypothetical protein